MKIPGRNKKILKTGALIHNQLLPNRNKPKTSAIANNGINAIQKVRLPMQPKDIVVTGLSSDIGVNRVAIPVLVRNADLVKKPCISSSSVVLNAF